MAKNRNIYLSLLQAGPYCQKSPHSLSHPSHSLGVTQEQFVKQFFHVIVSKSYNLPRQACSAVYPHVEICCWASSELKCLFMQYTGYWAWRNWPVNSTQSPSNRLTGLVQRTNSCDSSSQLISSGSLRNNSVSVIMG